MQKKHLLIMGYTWPEPSTTAAGDRMLQLIRFFLRQDLKIVFASTAKKTEYSIDLTKLGIECRKIILNDSGFDAFVSDLNPHMVLFDRFLTEEQFGWRVVESAPRALRILDTEDLHSLRTVREQCHKDKQQFTENLWLRNDLTKREIASIYRCDLSLIISSYEMQLLTDVVKMDKSILLHLPFQLEHIDKAHIGKWLPFEARTDFICVGNGNHKPNVDALVWLKKGIWPMIKKALPDSNLNVYGAYLPEHVRQMHNPKTGFLIKGWATDMAQIMGQSRINLAPLRFGAGIKGKLIDAMRYGTPSVTTTIGAEGMHGDLDWNGRIAHTADGIAEAAIALYKNKAEWQQAQQNGIGIINTIYDKDILDKKLGDKLNAIQADFAQHRTRNFLGAMLLHQTLASTKYLSKWIEEKHRK